MPDYGLFDAVISHSFNVGPFDTTLTARMNNIFDTEYISDARDGSGSIANTALVYFGYGRTLPTSKLAYWERSHTNETAL